MSVQVIIRNQAMEKILEEIIAEFYDIRPRDAEAFERIVDEQSKNLIKPTGMSREGHFLSYCKIPSIIYSFIKKYFRENHGVDDFFKCKANYDMLVKVWQTAKIRRRPANRIVLGV